MGHLERNIGKVNLKPFFSKELKNKFKDDELNPMEITVEGFQNIRKEELIKMYADFGDQIIDEIERLIQKNETKVLRDLINEKSKNIEFELKLTKAKSNSDEKFTALVNENITKRYIAIENYFTEEGIDKTKETPVQLSYDKELPKIAAITNYIIENGTDFYYVTFNDQPQPYNVLVRFSIIYEFLRRICPDIEVENLPEELNVVKKDISEIDLTKKFEIINKIYYQLG